MPSTEISLVNSGGTDGWTRVEREVGVALVEVGVEGVVFPVDANEDEGSAELAEDDAAATGDDGDDDDADGDAA